MKKAEKTPTPKKLAESEANVVAEGDGCLAYDSGYAVYDNGSGRTVIVFAPKYRRKVFYGEKRQAIGKILRQLCEWKGVRIVEAEMCPDHVHMLVEIPPKISVSSYMGYLKGKSSTMLYEQFGELKYK